MEIEDCVHGIIRIPSDIAHIIKTKTFQRLKEIKQLAFLYKIDSNAEYTRYEHCIGVYHLSKKMLDALEKNSGIKIPHIYQKAVQIAALLHDVGHGPFSHTWEKVNTKFHHEENASPCVDAIFDEIPAEILLVLREHNNYGINLVKALILGQPKRLQVALPDEHRYLFEIVHNKQCKLDVDKWDYIQRDSYYLKSLCKLELNLDDIFLKARTAEDGSHIEYRYTDYDKIYSLFEARWKLQLNCYYLPLNCFCDKLLTRIVERSNERIAGKALLNITGEDKSAFLQLTDENVLELVKDDQDIMYIINNKAIDYQTYEYCENEEQQQIDTKSEFITIKLIGPGREMPEDSDFHFYGNKSEKKKIQRNTKTTQISAVFRYNRD